MTVKELKAYAKTGKCPNGNLIEVMCCEGGCIGGNAGLSSIKAALKKVGEYAAQGDSLSNRKP